MRYGTSDAVKGWEDLCRQAESNTVWAWSQVRSNPAPAPPTSRHHRLKGQLKTGRHNGRDLPLWQIEVTSKSRVWYLLDEERRTVWLVHAGTAHPKITD
ncbi:hypothetical protein ABN034_22135 [Actinopolymorpha sp. B11F2]|uniref:hypothetical protein n=1 Tax=Actinopolymorpha sp. B11F2 TaxID=3160862 RepID=UPI0032E51E35